MNKTLTDHAVPSTIGGAAGVLWLLYGGWLNLIPPELSQTQELALTAAVGVVATTIVNMVRRVLYPENPNKNLRVQEGTGGGIAPI